MRLRHRVPALPAALLLCLAGPLGAQAPPGSVLGTVVDRSEEPVPGVLVILDRRPDRSLRSGDDGTFRLEDVRSGPHWIDFRLSGLLPHAVRVELAGGQGADLGLVTLDPGGAPTAMLAGVVTSRDTGRPLDGAEIELNGRVVGLTDERGVFRLEGVRVAWGQNLVRADHLGFATGARDVWIIESGQTAQVILPLAPAPVELPGVLVEGVSGPMLSGTELQAFEQRRRSTNGYFLDRAQIEARSPDGLTTLLRAVPGARIRNVIEGTELIFTRRTRSLNNFDGEHQQIPDGCRSPLIFLDGVLVEGDTGAWVGFDELIHLDDVAAVEVYNGASRIPTMFNTMGSGCGVVALWTGRGSALSGPSTAPTLRPPGPQIDRSRRNLLIGAVAVPAAFFVIRAAVCSLPHYCR